MYTPVDHCNFSLIIESKTKIEKFFLRAIEKVSFKATFNLIIVLFKGFYRVTSEKYFRIK